MKAPQWYAVQVSDTTMLPMAAALPGQLFSLHACILFHVQIIYG